MTLDEALGAARESFDRRSWGPARDAFARADAASPLGADDLERLAIAAYLTGGDEQCCDAWARAYRGHLAGDDADAAARCALWLGCVNILRGQMAPARGWFGRTRRLAADRPADSLSAGCGLMATGLEALFGGDFAAAEPALAASAHIGVRHGIADLAALGRLGCGQAAIGTGRAREGMALLDEAMTAVVAGETGPIATGIIYCAVIDACQELFDVRRAQEWTDALASWCAEQPELVPYRGQCLVHRAELLRVHGSWGAALTAAEQASQRLEEPPHPAAGAALYEQAELHRLRGHERDAADLYRQACEWGHSGQPGLALLWFGQGRIDAAAAALERALAEPHFLAGRALLLRAQVHVLLARGDEPAAGASADELMELATQFDSPTMLAAMADDAIGWVRLVEGDARAALRHLRGAWTRWHELDAPYEMALARVGIGIACRELDDHDSAQIELAAARAVFVELAAAPDVARVDALVGGRSTGAGATLTARELEVITLLATGCTNRVIADTLFISEKTVARHVSNIFTKIGVSTRAAATAHAYEHGLVASPSHRP
jgi:DNA-binding CsgD family transcriptional regulator